MYLYTTSHIIHNTPPVLGPSSFSLVLQAHSKNILVVGSKNILLDRTGNSLQRLMRLTLGIVVLHILKGGKCCLDGDVVAFVTGVVVGKADGCGDDIRLAVLARW
jgi:hypothetical protein